MVDYGMKVSEAGYDIADAADKNLILKTDLTLLKVFSSGTTSLSTTVWTEVAHNLGYVPQFLVYWNDDSASKTYLCVGLVNKVMARADTAKLYISKTGDASDTAYYYIFYEQA